MELNWAAIIIAVISLLVSIWAITVSKRANRLAETKFEREKKIEKPVLFNAHVDSAGCFVFIIEDYSANKNLRIDKIEFKRDEDNTYGEITFEVRRNDSINPPQMEVITQDSFNVLDALWFKIHTNFGEVLEFKQGSYFSNENPKD